MGVKGGDVKESWYMMYNFSYACILLVEGGMEFPPLEFETVRIAMVVPEWTKSMPGNWKV